MPSAFGRIISNSRTTPAQPMRDLCNRPSVFYNNNYDLASLSPVDLVKNYSLCDWKEPLFDDRSIVVVFLPLQHESFLLVG
jgi:hypothetical protein